jgi:hypothetical protein
VDLQFFLKVVGEQKDISQVLLILQRGEHLVARKEMAVGMVEQVAQVYSFTVQNLLAEAAEQQVIQATAALVGNTVSLCLDIIQVRTETVEVFPVMAAAAAEVLSEIIILLATEAALA